MALEKPALPERNRKIPYRSQSGGGIDELPGQVESICEMRRERLHPERFRRVMAAEQKVDAKFLRRDRRPMRRFASDESVDALTRDCVDFGARSAGDKAD